jgi:hypothetical protein
MTDREAAEPEGAAMLERFPTGWNHPVDKKALQIQKLEHIPVARIEWIRAEYALGCVDIWVLEEDSLSPENLIQG